MTKRRTKRNRRPKRLDEKDLASLRNRGRLVKNEDGTFRFTRKDNRKSVHIDARIHKILKHYSKLRNQSITKILEYAAIEFLYRYSSLDVPVDVY